MDKLSKEKAELLKKLGAHIKKIRLEKGLSGAELAKRCEMDAPHISRLEAGGLNASVFYLNRICKGLGISLSDLFKDLEH